MKKLNFSKTFMEKVESKICNKKLYIKNDDFYRYLIHNLLDIFLLSFVCLCFYLIYFWGGWRRGGKKYIEST